MKGFFGFALTINLRFVWLIMMTCIYSSCHKETMQPGTSVIPSSTIWWNEDVFYEIFIRSFYDTNGDGVGDLKGIIQKLDYLNDGDSLTNTDLGITAIWLMPVYPSPSYHGYDVTDFRSVKPEYGTMDDFRLLISECHKRGIKVILDFEITATSNQHPWFVNSASSASAGYRNWYIWSDSDPGYPGPWGQMVWFNKNNAWYYGTFSSEMPHLNYKNSSVTKEIESTIRYWHQDIGVDGFRMDAVPLMVEEGMLQMNTPSTHSWWRDFYIFQKNLDPSLMTVGEVWLSTPDIQSYSDHRLDYCFEFDLARAIIESIQSGNVSRISSKMTEVLMTYPARQYGTFLTNHDQLRVIEEFNLDFQKAKVAAGLLLTLPGVPYLYYGEEVGMRGVKPDEDLRKPMQWTSGPAAGFTTAVPWRSINDDYATHNVTNMKVDSTSLWNHYRKLVHTRTGSKALKSGTYEPLEVNLPGVFAFLRVKDNEAMMVMHNLASGSNSGFQISGNSITLSAGSYMVTEILSNAAVGTLTVAGGAFTYSSSVSFGGYETMLLSLHKQ